MRTLRPGRCPLRVNSITRRARKSCVGLHARCNFPPPFVFILPIDKLMKSLFTLLLAASTMQAAPGDLAKLKVLYIGSERAETFSAFLHSNVAQVATCAR